jgi:hypothetical protein
MQEPYWTLPMAVAWIRSKSPDAVREQWDAWLEQCLERRSHEDGYYYLEPRRKASLAELIATSTENKEAWEALRQALQNGEPTATAFHTATGERVCVPCGRAQESRGPSMSAEPLPVPQDWRYGLATRSPRRGPFGHSGYGLPLGPLLDARGDDAGQRGKLLLQPLAFLGRAFDIACTVGAVDI